MSKQQPPKALTNPDLQHLLIRVGRWVGRQEIVFAALVYAVSVVALFAPVVFLGRTLQAPLYLPHGMTDKGAYGYDGRLPVNTFNIDLASAGYYEWPLNILAGNSYKQGDAPLWNPYQGVGMPLAAQYNSRVLFPYQVLIDVMPRGTWDFLFLGRLWIAGIFTFLFLRLLGVSRLSAFLGGVFYMFSGTFVWFINFEQMVNVAMVTPILLWTAEGLWRWHRGPGIVGMAVAVGLTLLAGQPEMAFFVLLLMGTYIGFRLVGTEPAQRLRMAGLSLLGIGLGIMLASPLLLPFFELERQSWSIHGPTVTMGTQSIPPITTALQIIFPTVFEMPTWQRFFPDNGWWDFTGGYTGILLPYLLVLGGVVGCLHARSPWRGVFLLFTGFGVLVLLKDFGFPPVLWIGELPVFNRAWSQRWAGPAWTFSLAVGGALAVQMLQEKVTSVSLAGSPRLLPRLRRRVALMSAPSIALGFLLLLISRPWLSRQMDSLQDAWWKYSGLGNLPPYDMATTIAYFVPSAIIGIGVALTIVLVAVLVSRGLLSNGRGLGSLIPLALLELWFAIPQGYDSTVVKLKVLPLAVGLVAVWALFWGRRPLALALGIAAVAVALLIDASSEHGMPSRHDSSAVPPYIAFLNAQEGHYRVMGGDGVLFPNFASAVGIQDVRYIAALSVSTYQQFKDKNLHVDPLWPPGGPTLWFTGGPQREVLGSECCVGYRIGRSFWEDLEGKLPFYSLLGVRYILSPSDDGTSTQNLLLNGDLNSWSRGPGPFAQDGASWADGWDIDVVGDSSLQLSRISELGEPAIEQGAKIQYTHVNGKSYVRYILPEYTQLQGKTLTFSMLVETDKPRAVRVGISGVGSGGSWSTYHSGSGDWERLVTTHTLPPSGVKTVMVLVEFSSSSLVSIAKAKLSEGFELYQGTLQERLPLVYDSEIKIYENPNALPRAFISHRVQLVGSSAEALEAIRQPDFDLANTIVLEGPLSKAFMRTSNKDINVSAGISESASIVDYRVNEVTIHATAQRPGVLVLTDQFYPGWRAWVDGLPAKTYRVDGVFRGVLIEQGEHTIVFRYLPKSFGLGAMLAGVALLVCTVLLVIPMKRLYVKGGLN